MVCVASVDLVGSVTGCVRCFELAKAAGRWFFASAWFIFLNIDELSFSVVKIECVIRITHSWGSHKVLNGVYC